MAKVFKSYREESKTDWGRALEPNENICHEQIRTGAILRIADALEIMARSYQSLIEERDTYKRRYEDEKQLRRRARLRQYALKGVITKLKKAS